MGSRIYTLEPDRLELSVTPAIATTTNTIITSRFCRRHSCSRILFRVLCFRKIKTQVVGQVNTCSDLKMKLATMRGAMGSRVYTREPERLEPKVNAATTPSRWAVGSRICTVEPDTLEPAGTARWVMGSRVYTLEPEQLEPNSNNNDNNSSAVGHGLAHIYIYIYIHVIIKMLSLT